MRIFDYAGGPAAGPRASSSDLRDALAAMLYAYPPTAEKVAAAAAGRMYA